MLTIELLSSQLLGGAFLLTMRVLLAYGGRLFLTSLFFAHNGSVCLST